MLRKLFISVVVFALVIMSFSYAGVPHYSTNTIMPKNHNTNPTGDVATPKQNSETKTSNNEPTTANQPIQLTAEQLFELQKAQALQAMQAASIAQANQAAQNAQMQALANAMLDIPSGFTADGFAYGLARLAHNLSIKRGEVNFVSATKIKDKQYYVVCQSRDSYANGTFLVDIFPANETELKSGYQMWFTLYDINAKKLGTAQVKKLHN